MLPQQHGGYPQQQGGYPQQQGGYPQQQGGYPQQQGGYPPQQGGYPPQQQFQTPSKTLSGFERINKDGIYIKQKVDIAEVASGCERQNSYSIFNLDKAGEKTGVELLRARETSNCCVRQCFGGACRPFVLNVQLRDNDEKAHNQPFLEIERPCTCTCMCFGRPVANITHVEGGKRTFLGKIVNPYKCFNCDLKLEVFNAANALTYKVNARCCQTGVQYGMYPCKPCQTVDFTITTAGGMIVGALQKKTAGLCASAVSNADNYAVTFPNNATVEDKALLTATALFADYQFFERAGL